MKEESPEKAGTPAPIVMAEAPINGTLKVRAMTPAAPASPKSDSLQPVSVTESCGNVKLDTAVGCTIITDKVCARVIDERDG